METIDYPFEYKVTRSGDHYIIDAQIDMSVLSLEELFWDVFAVTEKNGEEVRVSAYWSRWQRLKLLLISSRCWAYSRSSWGWSCLSSRPVSGC